MTWLKNADNKQRAAPSFPSMGNKEAKLIVDHLISLKSKHQIVAQRTRP
ncbi:hypothetical protein SAMN02745724_00323 [Pseudoalteromonas denitrificans DSM 6059]|uniref:Uncharacterized protein n=1 Tax=Pseudoalteromonas denitrificans DSM 6059 TaxID=1123010 RepID=A0A1I1EKD7_9GAMM|nr:hypothetical protein SAMN02745724_00323 [Pseudoalteromonas denitrificans DSM 6059]